MSPWTLVEPNAYVSEMSDLRGQDVRCPCGKARVEFPAFTAQRDAEGELQCLTGTCGCGVSLTVFND